MNKHLVGLVVLTLSFACGLSHGAEKKTLSQRTYKSLMAAQESLEKGEAAKAIAALKKLLAGLEGKPYEQAIVLQGLSHVHISRENYVAAIPPLTRSVDLGALPDEPRQQARYNLVRLHMATEGYAEAIDLLKVWFAQAERPQAEAYVMLAKAYLRLGRYREAVDPLRTAIKISDEPKESWHQSLLAAHSELKQYDQCETLLHTMLKHFPDRPNYWRQLASVQLTRDKFRDALATMELAYLRGHLEEERELLNLAQLYLYLNAPYKAAALIEKEIKRGRIHETEKNWAHAGNAWLLARETNKAVAALEKAKAILRNPKLGIRLAQLYIESRRWKEAGRALDRIITDGTLDAARVGQAWILLGIARHEVKSLPEARAAFEQAKKYPKTADSAEQWLAFLDQT